MPEINSSFFSGKIIKKEESHKHNNEQFYRFIVEVPRLSNNVDYLPIIVSEKLLYNNEVMVGDYVKINGQIRTRNHRTPERRRLLVFGYATEIEKITKEEFDKIEDKNIVELVGYVVKKPVHRETKSNRKITELLVASNRLHNKSDYIPSIAWGVDAVYSSKFKVGDKVSYKGRFQSRDYVTRGENDELVTRTTYEVSIAQISIVENDE